MPRQGTAGFDSPLSPERVVNMMLATGMTPGRTPLLTPERGLPQTHYNPSSSFNAKAILGEVSDGLDAEIGELSRDVMGDLHFSPQQVPFSLWSPDQGLYAGGRQKMSISMKPFPDPSPYKMQSPLNALACHAVKDIHLENVAATSKGGKQRGKAARKTSRRTLNMDEGANDSAVDRMAQQDFATAAIPSSSSSSSSSSRQQSNGKGTNPSSKPRRLSSSPCKNELGDDEGFMPCKREKKMPSSSQASAQDSNSSDEALSRATSEGVVSRPPLLTSLSDMASFTIIAPPAPMKAATSHDVSAVSVSSSSLLAPLSVAVQQLRRSSSDEACSSFEPDASNGRNDQALSSADQSMTASSSAETHTVTKPKRGKYKCGKCGYYPKKEKHDCEQIRAQREKRNRLGSGLQHLASVTSSVSNHSVATAPQTSSSLSSPLAPASLPHQSVASSSVHPATPISSVSSASVCTPMDLTPPPFSAALSFQQKLPHAQLQEHQSNQVVVSRSTQESHVARPSSLSTSMAMAATQPQQHHQQQQLKLTQTPLQALIPLLHPANPSQTKA